MTEFRIGLTADLFDSAGRPVFGESPLQLFINAGLPWDVLPHNHGVIAPDALADDDALFIGDSRMSIVDVLAGRVPEFVVNCAALSYARVEGWRRD